MSEHIPESFLSDADVARLFASRCEYDQMLASLHFYKPRPEVRHWIWKAYNDHEWDWKKSDGCTLVSEARFPRGYRYPPCVAHDYICENSDRLNVSREFGDLILLHGSLDYRMWAPRAYWRYAGVRGFWLLIRQWFS